jgi:hypothetical protein
MTISSTAVISPRQVPISQCQIRWLTAGELFFRFITEIVLIRQYVAPRSSCARDHARRC